MPGPSGRQLIFIAFMLSLLLHAAYALLVFQDPVRRQKVISVDLLDYQKDTAPEQDRQVELVQQGEKLHQETVENLIKKRPRSLDTKTGPDMPVPPGIGFGAKKMKGMQEITSPVKNREMQEALRNIRKKIDKFWEDSESSSQGKVRLSLRIDTQGRIVTLWLNELEGTPDWGQHILDIVRKAGPFAKAMEELSEPLELDCVFEKSVGTVTGQVAKK
mgnify:CR=1 FL=1